MEPVRFGSDFKNQPRIGQRYIQSTAGAVSLKSTKGDLLVQKVSVKRYIAGKKPEWAPEHSSEEESEDEAEDEIEDEGDSPRQVHVADIEDDLPEEVERQDHGQRKIYEPRIVTKHDDDEDDVVEEHEHKINWAKNTESSEGEEEEEEKEEDMLDEDVIERRRQLLKAKAKTQNAEEKDLLDIEEEDDDEEEEDDESSEYEEYSDSDEENGLRLKPVFVRKNDRVTVHEREKMQEDDMSEEKHKKLVEERKRQSARLVNEIMRDELKEVQGVEQEENLVITDDENDEEEYEAWKVRELKRIKRDKEEKEQRIKEKLEIERLRAMTEDERREELRKNPKIITNKSAKGKYKFLQKYYHRGAFFMDKEEEKYKEDFTGATLEDHFDKTVLPKVMQVKNFGRSGRTKYTHLVDQDTTQVDSPWFAETAQSMKFHAKIGGGQKQTFQKPSTKKR
ncbi:microfibrillar-associated protein 1-like [Hydractinia symbiolongicarpus]|uniref:microfibrillar-associated protein 1-like n=1 Tax=Hydractinia symbiolongicarpus TaxID=13093 RepID=UPI00254FA931|nr:microfibrillar-associated protein 1-like [Hydractinia symbiolongicarpus]